MLNVFVAPEFFWHGPMGPYVHTPTDVDPADAILEVLREALPAEEYPTFLFVLGTVVTAAVADIDEVLAGSSTVARNDVVRALGEAWLASAGPITDVIMDSLVNFIKNGHAYPAVEVRNRALVISSAAVEIGAGRGAAEIGGGELVTVLTTEKYFDSNEDFLLWDVTGRPVITEQMTAYPVIDPSGGDVKSSAFDPYSVFRLPNTAEPVHIAIEICLDHADHRLRKSLPPQSMVQPRSRHRPARDPVVRNAAASARRRGPRRRLGVQLRRRIPARRPSPTREGQHGVVAGVDCTFADYVDAGESRLRRAHAARPHRRGSGAVRSQAPGAVNAHFAIAPDVAVEVVPVARDRGPRLALRGWPRRRPHLRQARRRSPFAAESRWSASSCSSIAARTDAGTGVGRRVAASTNTCTKRPVAIGSSPAARPSPRLEGCRAPR